MSDTPKVVSALLYSEGEQKVKEEVEKELKVPDPDAKTAQAAIEEYKNVQNTPNG